MQQQQQQQPSEVRNTSGRQSKQQLVMLMIADQYDSGRPWRSNHTIAYLTILNPNPRRAFCELFAMAKR